MHVGRLSTPRVAIMRSRESIALSKLEEYDEVTMASLGSNSGDNECGFAASSRCFVLVEPLGLRKSHSRMSSTHLSHSGFRFLLRRIPLLSISSCLTSAAYHVPPLTIGKEDGNEEIAICCRRRKARTGRGGRERKRRTRLHKVSGASS